MVRIDVVDGAMSHEPAFAAASAEAWTPDGWVPDPRAQEAVTAWQSDLAEIPVDAVERAQIDVLTNWVTAAAAHCGLIGRPSPPSVVVHRTFLIALRALDDLVVKYI